MLHTLFLPYADQDRPPLNAKAICVEIETKLDAWSPDTEITSHGGRLGIMISCSGMSSQIELWHAVEPILAVGMFAEPRS